MSQSPFRDLAATVERIARTQPAWPTQLGLPGVATVADLVVAIRDTHPDSAVSDAAVRAVLRQRGDVEAGTVLVHALAYILDQRITRAATWDYLADALGDLTIVVFDTIGPADLDGLTHLAHRLVNRAHNRVYKRRIRIDGSGSNHVAEVTPAEPERLSRMSDDLGNHAGGVAELATTLADLAAYGAGIQEAIDSGALSSEVWEDVRDHRLRPAIAAKADRTARQRAATSRNLRKLDRYARRHLTAA
jgi:hypothetical protein